MISDSRTTLMLCGSRGYVMGFVGIFLKRRAGNEHVKRKLKVTLPAILIELKFQSGFAPIFHFPKVPVARFQLPAPRFRFNNICSMVETLPNSW